MVDLAAIVAAAARLRGAPRAPARITPILRSDWIDEIVGCTVAFKAEHLQRTGSFKYRGALNAVLSLNDDDAANGVVGHSSGNHGAALAAAAASRRIPSIVVVPEGTPAAKVANMERYGARVLLCEPTQRARTETSLEEARRTGGTLVHPYNDERVIAGQGTIGLELCEQLEDDVDAVLVPTSGGGMVSGIAAAVRARVPHARVIACEPAGKRLGAALAARTRVIDPSTTNTPLDSVADAIRTQSLGELPWQMCSTDGLLDETVLSVSDQMIARAMHLSLSELKQAVEPAGGVALAALLSPAFACLRQDGVTDPITGQRRPIRSVAAVVCGGNVDATVLHELCSRGASARVDGWSA